jgi:Carboxypeptidase regulatory-like domain
MGSTAAAQSVMTGAIIGTLADSSKNAIGTVHLVARNIDTNHETFATTDGDGRFRIVGLQPGTYIVEISTPGFNAIENIVVEVGRATIVEASRSFSSADPGHESSRPPGITTTEPNFSVNLNQISFNELPNSGRRWSNFAILAPATVLDGSFGAVSYRGISSLLNNNTIDGGANDQAFQSQERGGTRIGYGIGSPPFVRFTSTSRTIRRNTAWPRVA